MPRALHGPKAVQGPVSYKCALVFFVQLLPYLHTPWVLEHGQKCVAWERMMFTAVWDAVKHDRDAILDLLLDSLKK